MSKESWPTDFPPMPSLEVVADGGFSDGSHWEIHAGGTRENYLTLLYVVLPDGHRTGGGGHGGPILRSGRHMSLSVHRQSEPTLHYVVGRVQANVKRIRLTLTGAPAPTLEAQPVAESKELGVAFVARMLPSAADVANMEALDDLGRGIDARSTRHHIMMAGDSLPHDSGDGHISSTSSDYP